MGHLHLRHSHLPKQGEQIRSAFVGVVRSMYHFNISKHGRELQTVIDGKCEGEFRRFGALFADGAVPWSFPIVYHFLCFLPISLLWFVCRFNSGDMLTKKFNYDIVTKLVVYD